MIDGLANHHPNVLAKLTKPPMRPTHLYEIARGERPLGPKLMIRLKEAMARADRLREQGCLPEPRRRGRPRGL